MDLNTFEVNQLSQRNRSDRVVLPGRHCCWALIASYMLQRLVLTPLAAGYVGLPNAPASVQPDLTLTAVVVLWHDREITDT